MHTFLRGAASGVLTLAGALAVLACGCSAKHNTDAVAGREPTPAPKKAPPPIQPAAQPKGTGPLFVGGPAQPPVQPPARPPVQPADPPRRPADPPRQEKTQPVSGPVDPPADAGPGREAPPEPPVNIGDRIHPRTPPKVEGNTISRLGGKDLKQWVAQIKSRDPSRSTEAIRAVVLFGSASREAVPNLIERAQHAGDTSPRVNAILALGVVEILDADIPKVVAALADRLRNDGQSIVRAQAALALARFEAKDLKPAIDALAYRVEDPGSWEVRRAAIRVLAVAVFDKKNGPDPRALTPLSRVLGQGEPSALVRMEAAQALGMIGRPARDTDRALVTRALRNALYDPDKCVQLWARVSLIAHAERVEDQDLTAITNLFASQTMEHRVDACRALGVIHPLAKQAKGHPAAMRELARALSDPEPEVRIAALLALGAIGRDGSFALPNLKAMAESRDTDDATRKLVKNVIDIVSGLKQPEKGAPKKAP